MVINLQNESAKENAKQILAEFGTTVWRSQQSIKSPPKLTVVGLRSDFNPEEFRNAISKKNEELKKMLEKNESFIHVLSCWDFKNNSGLLLARN